MTITRRTAAAALACGPFIHIRAGAGQGPNILLFFPDQWRPDWTGLTKGLDVRTPNLERLAERGIQFTQAVVPSPLCAPSRACLASGREYLNCRVPSNQADYPADAPTMYGRLRDAGYHVMGCGKLDLHKKAKDWGIDGKRRMKEWGFSEMIDNAGKGDAVNSGAVTPKDPYMAMLHRRNLAQAHVEDFNRRRRSYAVTSPTPLPDDAYCDNYVGSNALELLGRAPRNAPWFMAINFTGPHAPMDITASMEPGVRGRRFAPARGNKEFDAATHERIRQNYTAMVENLDRWLGRMVDEIRSRGELERTLIVVSSDHGEMLGDHGLWGKSVPWQESIGVPLVMAGPGVNSGRVVNEPTTILDLTATFLDYGRAKPLPDMESLSLRAQLEGRGRARRRFVHSGLGPWRAVIEDRYKLVSGYGEKKRMLFDLRDDPYEERDIAGSKSRLADRLETLIRNAAPRSG